MAILGDTIVTKLTVLNDLSANTLAGNGSAITSLNMGNAGSGILAIERGGTGATSASAAWTALGGGASGKHADNYFALASHAHGNIASGGTISSTAVAPAGNATAASADYILISDTSNSGKIERGIQLTGETGKWINGNGALSAPTASTVGLGNVTNESKATMFTSAALTGTPTAPTAAEGTNSTQIATTAFVANAVSKGFAANDAMVFKGNAANAAAITGLTNYSAGWTYRASAAFSITNVGTVEIGDLIICTTDSATYNASHWTIVQTNIDGAVTGPASSTDARVAVFNGTSGKSIKDSGYTIGKSVPSNAVFTDTWRPVETTLTNQDLNNVTTAGFYNAGGGNSVTNKPSGVDHFGMTVIHRASGAYYTQILQVQNKTYRRYCDNGTWTAWTEDKYTDANTTYSAGTGISLSGTTFSNSGVRSVTAGSTNGTISVDTNGTSAEVAVKGLGSAAYTASTAYATSGHNHDNRYVYDKANVSGNMNTAATWRNAMGMINLSGTDTTINPNGQTSWHHFINISYQTESANMWQTQIANKAGTTDLWVRSRAGGTITDGTAWAAPWTKILTTANYGNHTHSYLPLAGGTMTGDITFTATTFSANPTDSKGLVWSGGTDGAKIFYRQTANNAGSLVLQVTDDGEEYINFRHTKGGQIYMKPNDRTFYPDTNNTGSIGTSSYKWANAYATTFHGALDGNADTATQFASAQSVALTGDVTGTASSQAGWSVATTLANSGVTAGNYGPSANASPAHGATFSVPYFTVDSKGRVTAASTKTITLPTDNNTNTAHTTFAWTNGSSAGPTGSLSGNHTAVSFGAIPSATGSVSGVVTTAAQTFAGDKTFNGKITVGGSGGCKLEYDSTAACLKFVF